MSRTLAYIARRSYVTRSAKYPLQAFLDRVLPLPGCLVRDLTFGHGRRVDLDRVLTSHTRHRRGQHDSSILSRGPQQGIVCLPRKLLRQLDDAFEVQRGAVEPQGAARIETQVRRDK